MSKTLSHDLFLVKRIPLFWFLIATGLFIAISLFILRNRPQDAPVVVTQVNDCPTYMNQIRLNGYKFTHPLLLTDVESEDAGMQPLKAKIIDFMKAKKEERNLITASVYVRKLDNGGWFAINPDDTYTP